LGQAALAAACQPGDYLKRQSTGWFARFFLV
jgi:hypothetical protein